MGKRNGIPVFAALRHVSVKIAVEESRLLGYKIPVRTSRETHYVSAKEHNQLMLCKI
jgi:hypothetical protein